MSQNSTLTLLQAGLIAGALSVLITAPVALLVARVFGWGWGVAYGFVVSALCTFVPLRRWRRQAMRSAAPGRG